MKLSLNWIKQYINFELPEVDELVQKIGSQLGEVESVENIGEKYQGVVVTRVVSCDDHPNADRLHVCKIDDGGVVKDVERDENGHVQVVCGAPNVRAGIMVAWLPPGSTVPESAGKDPFVLGARDLRGIKSNGMLASPKELALGDSHDGILEIDPYEWSLNQAEIKPGADFAATFGLDDHIIDIENKMFTHRPDLFGELGLAREVAGITGHAFGSPDWYKKVQDFPPVKGETLELAVANEAPELVPRFMTLVMKDVSIKPSPAWLQCQLMSMGQKPINNVVDVTNYIMLLTAQPTHAYDYDKLRGHRLMARLARPDEKITLLNHKTYQLDTADIVIADGEGAVGLAGVMGGGDSEVSADTKNIVLECATFDMYAVRRSSMRHGVFTDALTRFNKGQSPLQNDHVLHLLMQSIQDVAGGEVASAVCDLSQVEGREWVHPPVPVTTEFINTRLGLQLSADEMKMLLENVEFKVEILAEESQNSHASAMQGADEEQTEPYAEYGEGAPEAVTQQSAASGGRVSGSAGKQAVTLRVLAPFWRTDIETREDVVEEIGRLYGFDKLPLVLPQRSIKPVMKNPLLELKKTIRENLVKSGANEVLTYSFVHGQLLDKVGQDKTHAFKLSNALSPDLQYYRLSLMPSLLEKVHPNIKVGYDEFALFEMGKAHQTNQLDDNGLPREDDLTALVIAAADKVKKSGAAYYQARKYLQNLVGATLTFKPVPADMQHFDITKPYAMNRSAFVYAGDAFLGIIGEFRTGVSKNLKLPNYCAGFELDTQALQKVIGQGNRYVPLPKFPAVTQDMTLKVSADVPYQQLFDFVWRELEKVRPENTLPTLSPRSIYQRQDDPAHKQITLHFTIASYEKTLTAEQINAMLDQAAASAGEKFGAERV